MSAERPWMKFYPQDWRADERLRNCSLGARGLWLELIALMHRSERYGYLLINGKMPSDRALAIQSGASVDEVLAALEELEGEGVFSRDDDGLIFSRRMIRDEEKHRRASNFGKRGARAKSRKEKENKPPLEGTREGMLEGTLEGGLEGSKEETDKGTHQPRDQKPDTPLVSPKVKGPIPDDFEPREFGEGTDCRRIVDGWSPLEFERQLERFRAHHEAAGSRFVDWQAAWKTWVLNSVNFAQRGERRRELSGSSPGIDIVESILAEVEHEDSE